MNSITLAPIRRRVTALAAGLAMVAGAHAADPGRFDLSVNNAPAAQVFMQIGTGTPYSMLVTPEVSGNVSVTLKNVTVIEALESLRDLYGYDFKVTGTRVLVLPNTVQSRLFKVNYLPGRRQGGSDLRVSTGSAAMSGAGSPAPNGSNSNGSTSTPSTPTPGQSSRAVSDSAQVRTTSDADFWTEVQASLNALVGNTNGRGVVLNPAAGVIVVKATPAELIQVEKYLSAIQLSIERQVMLEAKIVEVTLSKDAQAGINWAGFGRVLGDKLSASFGIVGAGTVLGTTGAIGNNDVATTPASNINTNATGRGFYGLALQSPNFAALINFLQTQGDVSVLSSPRIATLNNQKAVLKVGSDEMFVTGITTNTTTSGTNAISSPTLTLTPFFSGIVLDVTPQIDADGVVMLHVHPAISNVAEKTKAIDLGSLGNYRLPLAASTVNESDSIVRIGDGQIVAIGGLMVQTNANNRSGVPGLQDAPLVGGLFRQTSDVNSKRELVILIKPTIIQSNGANWPDAPTAQMGAGTPIAHVEPATTSRVAIPGSGLKLDSTLTR
ncbi:MAG TPA: pilus (MSHA type) biogenesis protein MshL [Ideonella sp.]|uniref:pilus (MSHA type) biogenesis protein MshL n=1 Tax=Ideonella sp. TaxID=1929293 RepID=UPI002E2EF547|nr:pilus (MSHA type) biogenesis protein MshL [Ideonella sp.]HEX5686173.1 pilus (MSHA type) biogenesis protein MshL [Ideonella sp.]